ncbi:hypothetical protein ACVDG8_004410 [Mesorhizobium sp. ORM8.1]
MKDKFHVDVENSPPPGRGVEIRAGSAPDEADAGWVAVLQPDGHRLAGHADAEAFSVKALARPLRAISSPEKGHTRLPSKGKIDRPVVFVDRGGRGSGDLSGAGGKAKTAPTVANGEGTVRPAHPSAQAGPVHHQ